MERNGSRLIRILGLGLLLVPLLFLALFFLFPLFNIFSTSLVPNGMLDLSGFARLVTAPYYREVLWFTIWQAVISTVLTIILALPAAFVFSHFHFPGKSLFMSLATLPFVLPTVVVAAAFTSLIGPRGVLNVYLVAALGIQSPLIQLDRTLTIILIVHIFYNYAIALRIISGYWSNQNPRIEQAARVLGASGWRLWWYVQLPLLRPAILASAVLVFIFTFTSFGVVLLLGGPRFATLEVEIYRQTVNLFNLPVAAALSLLQIIIMFALLLFYTRLQQRSSSEVVSSQTISRAPANSTERIFVTVTLLFMAVLLFAPLIALVMMSLTTGDTKSTLHNYQQLFINTRNSVLFVPPIRAVGNSLVFASVTTLLALVFGSLTAFLLTRYKSWWLSLLDPFLMLPLATSAVTLGFGFIITFDGPPLNIRSSPLLIPFAHTMVATPFVVRSILPALRRIPPNIIDASRVLGAPPIIVWWTIEMPLISRAIFVGTIFAFTVSMGEFGASLFVARPDTPTIPIAIYRLIGQPGISNYGQALAMSSLLLIVSAISFLLIERFRSIGAGDF